ncbi:hypothetical protein D3C79_1058330 [compost metagenome]
MALAAIFCSFGSLAMALAQAMLHTFCVVMVGLKCWPQPGALHFFGLISLASISTALPTDPAQSSARHARRRRHASLRTGR